MCFLFAKKPGYAGHFGQHIGSFSIQITDHADTVKAKQIPLHMYVNCFSFLFFSFLFFSLLALLV